MRLTIQRVSDARVTVEGRVVGAIGPGLVVFVGISRQDGERDVALAVRKICDLRVFEGEAGQSFHRSVREVGGAVLVVSQFTLYADLRGGRRPAFDAAAPPAQARPLYERLVEALRATGVPVETGEFQAMMQVSLKNEGPVTLLFETARDPVAERSALD